MKKLYFTILALLGILFSVNAQSRFNIYQKNVVIKQIPTSDVDSITVSETTPHIVSFWQNGSVSHSFDTERIDSITSSHEDPFSYMGIVGFNDDLYIKDIDVLAKSTSGQFRSFVSSLPRKDGTLLYYAVDNAIDRLKSKEISTPLSSVNLIAFTDGLDQGSIMMNPRYSSSASYLNAMSELVRKSEFNGLPINAYAVGLRGNDVSDITTFQNNLARLASSADKSFEVSSVYDLRTKFLDIANQIISVSIRQTISLKIPGIDSGTHVRFVFDSESAESSNLYIDGTFYLNDCTLRDVSYHGMKSRSGSIVQGTRDGIFVTFTFMGLQREETGLTIPTDIRHYYKLPSSSVWQQNSEFTPDNNTQRMVSHVGTIVVLVLDCSSSLGSDFSKVQQYANEFIDMISNNAQQYEIKAPENAMAELNDANFNIIVSWDTVKHAESYQVYRSSSSSGSYTLVADNVTSTTWTDNIPLAGNNYYRVKAIGHGLTSGNSNTTNAVDYKLDEPANAKAVWNDNDDVIVSWDAVKHAESYQVYRSNSSSGSYTLVADDLGSTSWTDNAPLAGNNYYRVKAIGHGLTSGNSNTTDVLKYALDTPTNAKVVWNDNDDVFVSWDAVKHAEGYQVYRGSSSSGSYTLVADNLSSTHWTDTAPLAGSNYYRIKAIGHGLTSGNSNPTDVLNYALDAPTNAKAELDDINYNIVVSWDAVKHAESYQVYRSSSSSGSYTLVAENLGSTSWTDTDKALRSGWYYYQIMAVGHGLASRPSNPCEVLMDKSGTINGRDYVDLCLPSGTLWATKNIGATSPEYYGDYFAWGETEGYDSGKTTFNWSTYKWCKGSQSTITKYHDDTDNKKELDPEDDAAYVNWGSGWRMPSKAQFEELINSAYTTTEWTTMNGVNGRKITSKTNGNSIFLPAAGERYSTSFDDAGSYGYYWSRTLRLAGEAYSLCFFSRNVFSLGYLRSHGLSVRPVRVSQ